MQDLLPSYDINADQGGVRHQKKFLLNRHNIRQIEHGPLLFEKPFLENKVTDLIQAFTGLHV